MSQGVRPLNQSAIYFVSIVSERSYVTDWLRQRKLDDVHSYDSAVLPCSSVGVLRALQMTIRIFFL